MWIRAAVTQGTGEGANRLDSGSVRARHRQGLLSAVAGASGGGVNRGGGGFGYGRW